MFTFGVAQRALNDRECVGQEAGYEALAVTAGAVTGVSWKMSYVPSEFLKMMASGLINLPIQLVRDSFQCETDGFDRAALLDWLIGEFTISLFVQFLATL